MVRGMGLTFRFVQEGILESQLNVQLDRRSHLGNKFKLCDGYFHGVDIRSYNPKNKVIFDSINVLVDLIFRYLC